MALFGRSAEHPEEPVVDRDWLREMRELAVDPRQAYREQILAALGEAEQAEGDAILHEDAMVRELERAQACTARAQAVLKQARSLMRRVAEGHI
jgi:hypothetical protein